MRCEEAVVDPYGYVQGDNGPTLLRDLRDLRSHAAELLQRRLKVLHDLRGQHVRLLGSERLAMILFGGAVPARDRDVILDIKCSMHLDRAISALGGAPHRCKSGHAYMKRMVLEWGAVAGVELSGHVFLGEINGRDDPLHTSLLLAGWLVAQDRPLSAFVDDFPEMFMTSDIRVAMDKAEIDTLLAGCADGMNDAEVQTIDRVRLVWPNGWLLVRRSITEPKVTIRIEGETKEDLRQIGQDFADRFPVLGDPA